jgi:hypothetical protein
MNSTVFLAGNTKSIGFLCSVDSYSRDGVLVEIVEEEAKKLEIPTEMAI